MVVLTGINFFTFNQIVPTEDVARTVFIEHNIIPDMTTIVSCRDCGRQMVVNVANNKLGGYLKNLFLLCCFLEGQSLKFLIRNLGIGPKTACDYYSFCREVCYITMYFFRHGIIVAISGYFKKWYSSFLRTMNKLVKYSKQVNYKLSTFISSVEDVKFKSVSLSINSILFWEHPYISALTLVAINCLYWVLALKSWHFYSFIISTAYCLFHFYNDLINHNEEKNYDHQSETPKRFSSDKCDFQTTELRELLLKISKTFTLILDFRKKQPDLFCLFGTTICLLLNFVGRLVSGVVLLYFLLLGLLSFPGFILHVVPPTWTQWWFDTEDDALKEFYPELPEDALIHQLSLTQQSEDINDGLSQGKALTPVGEIFEDEEFNYSLKSSDSEEEEILAEGLNFQNPKIYHYEEKDHEFDTNFEMLT